MTSPWSPAVGSTDTAQQRKAWMLAQVKLCDLNIANFNPYFPSKTRVDSKVPHLSIVLLGAAGTCRIWSLLGGIQMSRGIPLTKHWDLDSFLSGSLCLLAAVRETGLLWLTLPPCHTVLTLGSKSMELTKLELKHSKAVSQFFTTATEVNKYIWYNFVSIWKGWMKRVKLLFPAVGNQLSRV